MMSKSKKLLANSASLSRYHFQNKDNKRPPVRPAYFYIPTAHMYPTNQQCDCCSRDIQTSLWLVRLSFPGKLCCNTFHKLMELVGLLPRLYPTSCPTAPYIHLTTPTVNKLYTTLIFSFCTYLSFFILPILTGQVKKIPKVW